MKTHPQQNTGALRYLLRYVGERRLAAGIVLSTFLQTVRGTLLMIAVQNATNRLLSGGSVWGAMALMLAAMLIAVPIASMREYFNQSYELILQKKLQLGLTAHIAKLPLAWYESAKQGDALSTYTADVELLGRWMGRQVPNALFTIFQFILVFFYSLTQNIWLTLIVFPALVGLPPLILRAAEPMKKLSRQARAAAGQALDKAQELLRDPEFVKTYCLENKFTQRVADALDAKRRAERKSGIYAGLVKAVTVVSSFLPGFIAVAAGILFLRRGLITAGFLIAFAQLSIQTFGSLLVSISGFFSATNRVSASATRIYELISQPAERTTGHTAPVDSQTAIELKHVSFSYPDGTQVLSDVSLKIGTGQIAALAGRSGSGKSTLFKLIMGFYPAASGEVLVFGRDVRDWDLGSLRALMAPVFQEPALFAAEIRENIGWAADDASDEQIMQAVTEAELSEFISSLPRGLHTPLSEKGVNLSGGQRQRMGIARMLLKDAPVLLFDEPTSALDSVTESRLAQVFERVRHGKTAVTIAHRLATIRNADIIYVLEQGRIVQTGTHNELIDQDGVYRSLYIEQHEGGSLA